MHLNMCVLCPVCVSRFVCALVLKNVEWISLAALRR